MVPKFRHERTIDVSLQLADVRRSPV